MEVKHLSPTITFFLLSVHVIIRAIMFDLLDIPCFDLKAQIRVNDTLGGTYGSC